ncbi:MAG: hypothetical protein J6J12_05520 [Oscillospiraceae bacterium]|nr:hypothetical protein [Oscillospiraceae bacterium]
MSAPQNFRSAFNGFNREDVVRYLEYINNKHNAQLNQLTEENAALRAQLDAAPAADTAEEVEALTEQLNEALARCAELEKQLSEQPAAPVVEEPVLSASAAEELEAYRRAERIEREAKERAELVYFQANGVLTEAAAKVDGISAQITDMADQVMTQLTQLQMAVSSSKQALQDASSIMNTIKPNK